jgi:uncharacterized protein YeaO (DUF488 family)
MAANPRPGIKLKRAYETSSVSDGRRVLVDRVWPRGISKSELRLDEWAKDLAPSPALRKWFGHDPSKWKTFKRQYFRELDGRPAAVVRIDALRRGRRLTLVYAAKEERHNNAIALKECLERKGRSMRRPKEAAHSVGTVLS